MPDWKEEFENQFDEALASSAPPKRKPKVRKKKTTTIHRSTKVEENNSLATKMQDGSFNLPIFLVICILTISLIASYNWKSFGSVYAQKMQQTNAQYAAMQRYQRDAYAQQDQQWDQYRQQEEVRRREYEDQAESAIRKTYGRTKSNRERITLLGILYNNNTAAARAGRKDFIFLNEDWTIDRMPTYLALDAEDREFLSKYVKN